MDFKVAGLGLGITALQMDIKVNGVTRELLERALAQANAGRKFVLRKMLEAVPRPRSDISEYAPRMEALQIPSDKIGFLIGPGGKNIKAMQEQYKVRISVLDDTGNVQVFGTDSKLVKECANAIRSMTRRRRSARGTPGTVKSARDFGAFIEILPGVEGLCHISELDEGYVDRVTDVVNVGDQVEVVIINVDDRGKIKLSRKAAMQPPKLIGGESGGSREPRLPPRFRKAPSRVPSAFREVSGSAPPAGPAPARFPPKPSTGVRALLLYRSASWIERASPPVARDRRSGRSSTSTDTASRWGDRDELDPVCRAGQRQCVVLAAAPVLASEPAPRALAVSSTTVSVSTNEVGTGWVVDRADNICGLDDPKMLSKPAKLDYDTLLRATPEMKKVKDDKIEPNSPQGIQLRQAAATRVQTAAGQGPRRRRLLQRVEDDQAHGRDARSPTSPRRVKALL
jgi:predicted RNA-binding protein with RPS1 domain